MGNLNEFFRDLGRNAYGLGENVASLGSAAIAEPVAGFAAMYDPAYGAQAIREGMTYTPRTQAGQMYQQGAARTLGAIAKPAMPIVDTWQRGVDIAGGYSPMAGAMLRTVPAAIGVAMGAKPALQAGRQVSNSLGAMQGRMIANANAPRTLNAGYMGQRGAINPSDFNLVTNPDGTVTMYHGTTKDAAKKIIQERKLLSAGEPDVYMTTDPMAGYGDGTTVKFNIDPKHINLDDEFPSGRVDFRMPAAKGWRIQNPEINTPKRPLTQFEQAHLTAQQRAALPVNQRGLDLPADNTAMDRARAMGFDVDNPVYTGISPREGYGKSELWNKLERKTDPNMTGFDRSVFSSTSPKVASGYTGVVNLSPDIQHRIAFDGLTEAKKLQNAEGFQPTFIGEKMLNDLGDDFTFNDVKNYLSDNDISPDDIMEFSKVIDTDKYHDVGSSIIPMYANKKDYLSLDAGGSNWDEVIRAGSYDEDNLLDSLVKQINEKTGKNISRDDVLSERGIEYDGQMDRNITTDDLKEIAKDYGLSGVEIKNVIDSAGNTRVKANTVATTKGHTLRALSAAFDPFNRDSSNLLAQSAKFVPAATLGALMANEKRKEKRN